MADRRATITVDIDLTKGSKEAHMVTVQRIADACGAEIVSAFEERGYSVRRASVNTTLHYVRHSATTWLRRPRKRLVKQSNSATTLFDVEEAGA